ncbi:MAG: hypothetical protein GY821_05150 [Gammaproteobacteria bacterium]|nr:hypothetical protein [Gammaproteobacteria bacterium]
MPMPAPDNIPSISEVAPFSAQVEQALTAYFRQLEETPPNGLYNLVLTEIEIPLMKTVLQHTRFNRLQAAKLLGISRTTFHKKLNDYALAEWIQDVQYRNVVAMEKDLAKALDAAEKPLTTPADIEETV